ncbi:MAG TPA: WD40 repeat domain-containing protein [Longimicrobiales bacterium]|nr:WD40 repeat domain-containing protein [Longimicrobiales bacterium]
MAMLPPWPRRSAFLAVLGSTLLACGDPETQPTDPTGPELTSGSVTVILQRRGDGDDADGVTVSLWSGSLVAAKPARLGDTISFGQVPTGAYTVSVAGLDPLCRGDVADVIAVAAESNVLRLQTECAGRLLYEKEFSETRVAVLYVGADSRLRTLPLQGRQHVRGTSPDGERALVEEWEPASCGVRIRTAVVTLEGGVVPLQQNPRRPVSAGARWSPAGGLIAGREEGVSSCGDGDERAIVLYEPATGAMVRTVAEGVVQVLGPDVAWSPDGVRLTYVSGNVILAYDVVTGSLTQLYSAAASERPRDLAWASTGRYLLFRPALGARLRVLDVSDGSVREIDVAGAGSAAWHPSANLLALHATDPARVLVVDVPNNTVTPAAADPVPDAAHPSWNAEGDRLLVSGRSPSGARALYVVDWPGREVWRVLEGDAGGPMRARWTRGTSAR